ncbi:hypothetical protein DXG01_000592, partial [Tephrocybe rancida]
MDRRTDILLCLYHGRLSAKLGLSNATQLLDLGANGANAFRYLLDSGIPAGHGFGIP